MLIEKLKMQMNMTEVDDASTSSTVTVDRGTKKALHEQPCQRKKSVSFDLSLTTTHACEYRLKDSERAALWYRGAEYKRLKDETFDRVRAIITSEGCNAGEGAYRKVMQRAFDACEGSQGSVTKKSVAKEDRKQMQRWAKSEEDIWGLEKWAVRKIRKDKFSRRKELTDKILEIQDMDCAEAKDELMRQCCEDIGRQTVLFSYLMGYSLAMAVGKTRK